MLRLVFSRVGGALSLAALGAASTVSAPARALPEHEVEGPEATRPASLVFDLDHAVAAGAERGPAVKVARAPRAGALDAEAHASSLPRAPVLTVAAGYRSASPTSGPELSASLLQDVSLRGLGSAREDTARALVHAVDADTERARLEGAARGGLAWVDVLEAKELLRLRREAHAQALAVLKTTEARVRSGVAQPVELALAKADAGAAVAAILDAEGAFTEARAEMRFALGLDAGADVDVQGDLYGTREDIVDEAAAIRAAEGRHPSLALARARSALAHEEVRLTHATLGPSLTLGAAYLREGTGNQIWTGIVGVPLPLVDPARYETARGQAQEDLANAQVEHTRAELARDIRKALHERAHWREVRDALSREALLPTREALRLAQVSYEVGTEGVATVLLARQRLVNVEEQLARVAAQVQRADLGFGLAAGTLLGEPRGGRR